MARKKFTQEFKQTIVELYHFSKELLIEEKQRQEDFIKSAETQIE